MTTTLELAEDALGRHFALEVLDRALEPAFTHVNFDWFALYGLNHERLYFLSKSAGGLHSVHGHARRARFQVIGSSNSTGSRAYWLSTLESAAFLAFPPLNRSPPSPASTTIVSPEVKRPAKMSSASPFSRWRWIARLSGRAP